METKTCTLKTLRCWWKKLKKIQPYGKIYHVCGLEESILSNRFIQSLSGYQWHFSQNYRKSSNFYGDTQKTPNNKSNLEKKKQSWGNQTPWPQTVTALLLSYTPIQNTNLKAVLKKQKEVMLVPGTQHTVFSAMQ